MGGGYRAVAAPRHRQNNSGGSSTNATGHVAAARCRQRHHVDRLEANAPGTRQKLLAVRGHIRRPRPPLLVVVAVVIRVAVLDDVRPGVVRLAQARHEVLVVLGPHAVPPVLLAAVAVLAARRVAGHEEVVVLVVAHGYGFGRWGCPARASLRGTAKTAEFPCRCELLSARRRPARTRPCGRGEVPSVLRDRTYAYAKRMRPSSVARVPRP